VDAGAVGAEAGKELVFLIFVNFHLSFGDVVLSLFSSEAGGPEQRDPRFVFLRRDHLIRRIQGSPRALLRVCGSLDSQRRKNKHASPVAAASFAFLALSLPLSLSFSALPNERPTTTTKQT